jgi:hypothetical protein
MPDSNPRGVKICNTQDGIVKAVFIPRNKLEEFKEREELQLPGIYFLVGEMDELGKRKIYIGEAETLQSRILQHNKTKDFWNSVICFLSEKNNINKAHIKYLESYSYTQAKKINKCILENTAQPAKANLTEQDEDFMMSFYDDVKLLISTLGFPILEESKKTNSNFYICKGKDAYATGEYLEDGFLVFKGSTSNLQESKTAGTWVINMRKKLINKGVLREENSQLIFTEDFLFSSVSAAATTVLARRANGWTEWKNKNNQTIDEIIRKNK